MTGMDARKRSCHAVTVLTNFGQNEATPTNDRHGCPQKALSRSDSFNEFGSEQSDTGE